ncbi:hypothetical protein Bca4012_010180 [Brassica carinata]
MLTDLKAGGDCSSTVETISWLQLHYTLSGQACGAMLYGKLRGQTYTSMFCLTLVCFPLSILWFNMEKLFFSLSETTLLHICCMANPWTLLLRRSAAPHSLLPEPDNDQTPPHYLYF